MFGTLHHSDQEKEYVLFNQPKGIIIGVSPRCWLLVQNFIDTQSDESTLNFTDPRNNTGSWGFDECFYPWTDDLLDPIQGYSGWKFWGCDAPIVIMDRTHNIDEGFRFHNFQAIFETLNLILQSFEVKNNSGQKSENLAFEDSQKIQIPFLPSQGKGSKVRVCGFEVSFSQIATRKLFSTLDHNLAMKNIFQCWESIMYHIRQHKSSQIDAFYFQAFNISIQPENYRLIQSVPGDCACLGGYIDANNHENGLILTPHNIDTLEQQFLHLCSIACLWKMLDLL